MMELYALIWNNIVPILIGLITFITIRQFFKSRGVNLPPGPTPIPGLGTIYNHGLSLSAEKLATMSKKYGKVFCIYLGPKRVLVLNSYESIREAMANPTKFAHRGFNDKLSWNLINPNNKGFIARDYNELFMQNRNHAISIIRYLGVGKTVMEDKIIQEAKCLEDIFHETHEMPFDPRHDLVTSVVNVMLHILLNKRYEHGDKDLLDAVANTEQYMALTVDTTLVDTLPFLRVFLSFRRLLQRLVKCQTALRTFLWDHAKSIIDNFDPKETNNFVECLLEQHYNANTKEIELDEENLKYMLVDLLSGAETTATSIRWTILCLANRPDIQEKLHNEIKDVIGLEKNILFSDKDKLPYLEAVIWEVQRCYNLGHLVPNMSDAENDTSLQGYTIPKGTMILLNHLSVHMDEETWGDPRTVRPERFLDENGAFVKHPKLVPFAIGQRSCPGELLAKQFLFIFTAKLFQHFKFSLADGEVWADETPTTVLGLTLAPKPFKIKAVPR